MSLTLLFIGGIIIVRMYMYAGYCTADCRFLFYLLSVCDLLCSFCIHVYLCCTLSCCVCPFCPSLPFIFLYLSYVACIFICLSTFLSIYSSLSLSPSLPVFSWCSLLSDASLQALEYYYDLQFYWKKGNSLQL